MCFETLVASDLPNVADGFRSEPQIHAKRPSQLQEAVGPIHGAWVHNTPHLEINERSLDPPRLKNQDLHTKYLLFNRERYITKADTVIPH
jgi:hypothetical protein